MEQIQENQSPQETKNSEQPLVQQKADTKIEEGKEQKPEPEKIQEQLQQQQQIQEQELKQQQQQQQQLQQQQQPQQQQQQADNPLQQNIQEKQEQEGKNETEQKEEKKDTEQKQEKHDVQEKQEKEEKKEMEQIEQKEQKEEKKEEQKAPEANKVVDKLGEQQVKFEQALVLKEEGNKLIKEKKYQDASDKYEQALSLIHPDILVEFIKANQKKYHEQLINIVNNLSFANLNLNNGEKAEQFAEIALKFDPTNVKGYYRKAQALKLQQKYSEALEEVKKAVQLSVDQQMNNNDIVEEYKKIKALYKEENLKDSQIFKKMFSENNQSNKEAKFNQGNSSVDGNSPNKDISLTSSQEKIFIGKQLDNKFINAFKSPILYFGSMGLGFFISYTLSRESKQYLGRKILFGGSVLSLTIYQCLANKSFVGKIVFTALSTATAALLKCLANDNFLQKLKNKMK